MIYLHGNFGIEAVAIFPSLVQLSLFQTFVTEFSCKI
jgi:hypothetical protein